MTERLHRPGLGILLRMLSVAMTACLTALVKAATLAGANTVETLFYRYTFSVPFILFWALTRGGFASLRTERLGSHAVRAAISMSSLFCAFLAVAALPLAEATTLFFTAPLLATVLSTLLLKEHVGVHRWAAIAVAIVGMLIMVRPGGHEGLTAAGIGYALLAAFLAAFSTITIRQLGLTEAPTVMIFWFTLIGAIVSGLAMPFYFQPHPLHVWLLLAGASVAGTIGQITVTWALRFAPVSVIAPVEYSQLLWAALLGWLIWSDLPGFSTIAGAALIGSAGLYTIYREHLHRRRRPGVAEETMAA